MDVIDTRTVYDENGVKIVINMVADTGSTPFDADCYSPGDIKAWRNDEWRYVGLLVSVAWRDVVIGTDSLWSVEHGTMPEARDVDAFRVVAPQEFNENGIIGRMAGSPAAETIIGALGDAEAWLDTLSANAARHLAPAEKWLSAQTAPATV